MNRSPLKVTAAVACAVALLLPLAGCGKDDKPKATGAAEVARYVADAEKICTASRTEVDAITKDAPPTPTAAELAETLSRLSVVLVAETDQLKALTPPGSIATAVDGWLDSLTTAAKATKDQTAASIRKSQQIGNETLFADADSRAESIGVRRCRTDVDGQ